ncbi:MAG: class I SAM-dependent methyltransferase [Ilumatobacteraceae bacterium]
MPPRTNLYDHGFYDAQAEGSRRSADVVLPILFELLRPTSIVDVGCGVGTWLAAASALGVTDVVGLDGAYAVDAGLRIDRQSFVVADLARSIPPMERQFDLAMSLEVAEHLPPARSDGFVADLCALSDVVLFSAAIPGQLGTDHINLALQHEWAQRFAAHGFVLFDVIRPRIWHEAAVEWYYRQNALVYVRDTRLDVVARADEMMRSGPPLLDAVHPDMLAFWIRRATRPVSTSQAVRQVGRSVSRAVRRRLRRADGAR